MNSETITLNGVKYVQEDEAKKARLWVELMMGLKDETASRLLSALQEITSKGAATCSQEELIRQSRSAAKAFAAGLAELVTQVLEARKTALSALDTASQ